MVSRCQFRTQMFLILWVKSVLDTLSKAKPSHNLAKTISRALCKKVAEQDQSADEMYCAVQWFIIETGQSLHSLFISYRVVSEVPLVSYSQNKTCSVKVKRKVSWRAAAYASVEHQSFSMYVFCMYLKQICMNTNERYSYWGNRKYLRTCVCVCIRPYFMFVLGYVYLSVSLRTLLVSARILVSILTYPVRICMCPSPYLHVS